MNESVQFKGWELENVGGGNFTFIKDLQTVNGSTVMVLLSELGAAIPLQDEVPCSYKTKAEYLEDYTYDYVEIVEWDDDTQSNIANQEASKFFTKDQIIEIKEALDELDKHL